MPNVTCQFCGNPVRVQGLAAICPHCGQLISITDENPTELDGVSAEETEYIPAPLPREFIQPPAPPTSPKIYYIIGAIAAALVVLVTVLLVVLTRSPPPAAPPTVVVAPKRVVKPTPPEPKGSDWFSDKPQPATAPVVARVPPTPLPDPPPALATRPQAPPPPHAELALLKPQPPQADARTITDEQIGTSIQRGAEFLLSQFSKTRLKGADAYDSETFAGLNALAVYALLHTGQALGDARLTQQSDLVKELLERLKEFPMTGRRATYSRSLRISALAVYNRAEDRATIDADAKYLLASSMKGAFDYDAPPPGRTRDNHPWDNSNSQYGALGLWAAADVGFKVPPYFWIDVEQHWNATQLHSGGWGYNATAQSALLSMTAAGANMLFVARDQITINEPPSNAYVPLTKAQTRALEWLDEGDNAINLDGGHRGYTLYGLERAGLACGYKYFGKHDWYLELATRTIKDQQPDGSWTGGDGTIAETCFSLLFLSRGRHPVFIAKLKYDGPWANRPRDLDVLTRFASRQLERPLNWQVADIERVWWEWSDAPVLLITSDRPPQFTDAQLTKLRGFVHAGGLIFTNTERESEPFNRFATELAQRLFPELALAPLDPGHEVYSIVYPMTQKPPLKAVSNGSRLLMVHSPQDLSRHWQPFPGRTQRTQSELVINIGVYAAGRRDLRNRLSTVYVPEPGTPASGIVPLARLKYKGNWDPEPAAWTRAARVMQNQTGIGVDPIPTLIEDLKYETTPIAHLTGTAEFGFSEADTDALRVFVTRGGVLVIDPCGGNKTFSDFVSQKLLPRLFLDQPPTPLAENDALLLPTSDGMRDLRSPKLRAGMRPTSMATLQTIRAGNGQIIISQLDITTGLLGTNTAGIAGYQPAYCQDLVNNLVLWTIRRLPRQ